MAESFEEDTLRTDLEAAFDAEEQRESEAPQEEGGPTEDTEESVRVTEATEGEGEPPREEEQPSTEAATEEIPAADEPPAEELAPVEDSPILAAPRSWNAPMREQWGNIPNDVREYIHQREREAAVAIQRHTEEANYGGAMQQILKPFESVMAIESSTPFQAVQSLAQTAATLRMGTPAEKANMIKHLITSYDVDIETLDKALVDEPVETPEQRAMKEYLDRELAPVRELLDRANAGRDAYAQQEDMRLDQEIQAFEASAPEFYEDVKADMADVLELHYRRTGRDMSMQEAYDRAVALNPDIRKVVEQREAAKRLAQKQTAAVSDAPSQPTPRIPESDGSLRGAIEAAWDSQDLNNRV